jgi:hypothetical protein
MIATIVLGVFCVMLAYLAGRRIVPWGLKAAFALIFLFLALRYQFGNDYATYLDLFNAQSDLVLTIEPAWTVLSWLFRPLGFFAMVAALALFNSLVYYHFIKEYVPERLYWLAVFIYVFNPDFMLIQASMMRQTVAILLFVLAIDFLYKKQAVRYFLCIGLATLFHFSALILAPMYLLALFDWRVDKLKAVLFVSIYISLFAFGGSLLPYVSQIVGAYFEKYAIYQDAGVVRSGLGFFYLTAMFLLTLSLDKDQNKRAATVFHIAIISFLLLPMTLLIDLTARLVMYFAIATIAVYPLIFRDLKNAIARTIYVSLLLAFISFKFATFFSSDIWKEYFGTYHTVLSAGQWN